MGVAAGVCAVGVVVGEILVEVASEAGESGTGERAKLGREHSSRMVSWTRSMTRLQLASVTQRTWRTPPVSAALAL